MAVKIAAMDMVEATDPGKGLLCVDGCQNLDEFNKRKSMRDQACEMSSKVSPTLLSGATKAGCLGRHRYKVQSRSEEELLRFASDLDAAMLFPASLRKALDERAINGRTIESIWKMRDSFGGLNLEEEIQKLRKFNDLGCELRFRFQLPGQMTDSDLLLLFDAIKSTSTCSIGLDELTFYLKLRFFMSDQACKSVFDAYQLGGSIGSQEFINLGQAINKVCVAFTAEENTYYKSISSLGGFSLDGDFCQICCCCCMGCACVCGCDKVDRAWISRRKTWPEALNKRLCNDLTPAMDPALDNFQVDSASAEVSSALLLHQFALCTEWECLEQYIFLCEQAAPISARWSRVLEDYGMDGGHQECPRATAFAGTLPRISPDESPVMTTAGAPPRPASWGFTGDCAVERPAKRIKIEETADVDEIEMDINHSLVWRSALGTRDALGNTGTIGEWLKTQRCR